MSAEDEDPSNDSHELCPDEQETTILTKASASNQATISSDAMERTEETKDDTAVTDQSCSLKDVTSDNKTEPDGDNLNEQDQENKADITSENAAQQDDPDEQVCP